MWSCSFLIFLLRCCTEWTDQQNRHIKCVYARALYVWFFFFGMCVCVCVGRIEKIYKFIPCQVHIYNKMYNKPVNFNVPRRVWMLCPLALLCFVLCQFWIRLWIVIVTVCGFEWLFSSLSLSLSSSPSSHSLVQLQFRFVDESVCSSLAHAPFLDTANE